VISILVKWQMAIRKVSPKKGVALLLSINVSQFFLGILLNPNKKREREKRSFTSPTHIQSCCHVFRRPRQGPHFSGLSLPSIIYTASCANVWDFENGRRRESNVFLLRRENELVSL
jgi:hypothetical protein